MAWPLPIGLAAQQGAIRDEHAASLQPVPPSGVGEIAIDPDINPVIAHRIGKHTGGTAGGRWNAQATVQSMIVNLLCPESVPLRTGPPLLISRSTPCFVRVN